MNIETKDSGHNQKNDNYATVIRLRISLQRLLFGLRNPHTDITQMVVHYFTPAVNILFSVRFSANNSQYIT